VTVFLARALSERGYDVLVLDADSTNVGLASALGAPREPDPLLDHFGGMVFSGGTVTCPVDDPTPLPGAELALGNLAPRSVGWTPEGICLLQAGKLGALGPGAGCDGPVAKVARDLRVTGFGPDPVVVVDFKAGFEDAARGAVTSVDWALVVVDPTVAALRMAKDLAEMVEQIRHGTPPATRHLETPELVEEAIGVFRRSRVRGVRSVLNRIPTDVTEGYMREELSKGCAPPLGAFPVDTRVAEQWLRGEVLDSACLADVARTLVDQIGVA
jgi:CO dehydrogenase nickel-insertion accessory protein CooC1